MEGDGVLALRYKAGTSGCGDTATEISSVLSGGGHHPLGRARDDAHVYALRAVDHEEHDPHHG